MFSTICAATEPAPRAIASAQAARDTALTKRTSFLTVRARSDRMNAIAAAVALQSRIADALSSRSGSGNPTKPPVPPGPPPNHHTSGPIAATMKYPTPNSEAAAPTTIATTRIEARTALRGTWLRADRTVIVTGFSSCGLIEYREYNDYR